MNILAILALGGALVGAVMIGFCLAWATLPQVVNWKHMRLVARLKREIEMLSRKLDASRAAMKAMENSLAICHRERDVANDAAAQLITLTQQATNSLAALTEKIDPQGGGTEPL